MANPKSVTHTHPLPSDESIASPSLYDGTSPLHVDSNGIVRDENNREIAKDMVLFRTAYPTALDPKPFSVRSSDLERTMLDSELRYREARDEEFAAKIATKVVEALRTANVVK